MSNQALIKLDGPVIKNEHPFAEADRIASIKKGEPAVHAEAEVVPIQAEQSQAASAEVHSDVA